MEHLHGHMGISLVLELTHLALPRYYGPSRTEAEHPQPRFGEVGEADSLRMQSLQYGISHHGQLHHATMVSR